jgi:hypothetical protein
MAYCLSQPRCVKREKRKKTMPTYRIIATIEVTTEANSHEEAELIGLDCLDWANADIEVLEEEEDNA